MRVRHVTKDAAAQLIIMQYAAYNRPDGANQLMTISSADDPQSADQERTAKVSRVYLRIRRTPLDGMINHGTLESAASEIEPKGTPNRVAFPG